MLIREQLATLRLFTAIFFSLLGLGMVLHGGEDGRLVLGAVLGGVGITTLLLYYLSASGDHR